ncbi:sugar diacid recognition domain-containing protein [Nonomuraea sp. NPDC049750]|uniref:CdaR family transcriptional regulator n=1 Tax=Nonomuraea sp. NPDC049750 TaxID=3154738 RepID=UPI0033D3C85D
MSQPWPPVLTPTLAQGIAGDTSEIIGFNVLITDPDGLVIGSGDTRRIGSFHEASVEVMRTLKSAAHSAEQARRLQGVRPGITLPIIIDGRALGTVGITGSPARVQRFGLVVKRQTEIMLQESMRLRSRLLLERTVEDLLRDIARFDPDVVNPEDLVARAGELGYDLRAERTAVIVDVGEGAPSHDGSGVRSMLLRAIRETFSGSQDLVAAMTSSRFAALPRRPAGTDLRSLCLPLAGHIRQRIGLRVGIGLGVAADSVPGLHDSYEDAATALRLGPRVHADAQVHSIGDLRVHQLLAAAPRRARSRFAGVSTAGLRARPDWPMLRQTVIAYCESGFNLVRAAAVLNIHRNTLLYRLDKISQLSGRPADDHRARLALYLACVADQIEP